MVGKYPPILLESEKIIAMECKHCGAPLNEEDTVCAECGTAADLQETAAEECAEVAEETESAEEIKAEAAEKTSAPEEPAKKNTGLIVALVACLAAIAVLLVLLISGGKSQPAENEPPIIPPEDQTLEEPAAESETAETESSESGGIDEDWLVEPYVPTVSYVIDDAAAFDEELLSQVVAACGDSELTNELLAYYYWREFFTFSNMYSTYLTMLMDPYGRLDQQQSFTQGMSWDELFMESALESFHVYGSAAAAAREAGYALNEEERAGLDHIPEEMATYAELYGYESADDYLKVTFGPYATLDGYMAFMEEYMLGASYLESLLNAEEITPDVIDAYYEENKDSFIAAGLEKDDRPMVNIRHILFMPAEVEIAEGEEGYEEAVAAALADAEAAANEIYEQWKSGEMTEESFAELAKAHSADGSAAAGGLIENIRPDQTVENFDAWCFAEGRKAGDHGLVQTEFGYHIIFLSAVQEQSYWYQTMLTEYENERYLEICEELTERYPLTSDLTKAAIYPANTEINKAQ